MTRRILQLALFSVLLLPVTLQGQLTGTKNIPGDYADLPTAIADLNAQGVGPGGVTFLLGANQSLSATIEIGSTTLNSSASAANPVTINGGGFTISANFAGTRAGSLTTGANDGVIVIKGTDYITIQDCSFTEQGSNTTTTTAIENAIAMYNASATAPFDGCQHIHITGCTFGLGKAATNGAAIYSTSYTFTGTTNLAWGTFGASPGDMHRYIHVQNNTFNGSYNFVVFRGSSTGANGIGLIVTGNTMNDIGGGSITSYGTYALYLDSLMFNNNTASTSPTQASTNYIAFASTSCGGKQEAIGNNITLQANVTTSATNGINYTSIGEDRQINNNTITFGPFPSITSGTITVLNATYSGGNSNIDLEMNGNILTNQTIPPTTGTVTLFRNDGSAATSNRVTYLLNNTINNITKDNSGTMYLLYAGTSDSVVVANNTLTNVTRNNNSASTAASTYGIYLSNSAVAMAIHNNTIANITTSGTATSTAGIIRGIYGFPATTSTSSYFNNDIHDLSFGVGTHTGVAAGIYLQGSATGTDADCYNNKIYNISAQQALGKAYGIYSSSGNIVNIYNNVISGLSTPSANATTTEAIAGINLIGTTTMYNVSFNTIYPSSGSPLTSTGVDFGAAGIFVASTSAAELRNNIVNITGTANGTGYISALKRSTGTAGMKPANITATNNIYNAPYIYGEGTNLGTATNVFYIMGGTTGTPDPNFNTPCSVYKVFMGETGTFSENNLVPAGVGLYAPSGVSFAESGATTNTTPVINTDYNGVTRGATPDIGALQFSGIATDAAAPLIVYDDIPNPNCTNAPDLSATITDATGVNTAAGTKPRLWFKKSTELNVLPASNTSADNGWKYVEATNSSSPFSFQIDYSLLFSAVVVGDVIEYFVVAQDLVAMPNVGTNVGAYNGGFCPVSVALAPGAFPISGVKSYTVFGAPMVMISANPSSVCVNNDATLTAIISQPGTIDIGTTTSSSSTYTPYYGSTTAARRIQYIYTAAELLAQGLTAGDITAMSFYLATVPTAFNIPDFQLKFGHTTLDVLPTTTFSTDPNVVVFNGSYSPVVGTNTHIFTTPFTWDGVSNIIIEACHGVVGTSSLTAVIYTGSLPTGITCYSTTSTGCTTATGTRTTIRPIASFTGKIGVNQDFVNFVWNDGTSNVGTNNDTTVVQPPFPGGVNTMTYTLAATDVNGCLANGSVMVTKNTTTPTGTASISDTEICVGQSIILSSTVVNGCPPYSYEWSDGVNIVGTDATIILFPTANTTYTLEITDNAGQTFTPPSVQVDVNNPMVLTTTPGFECGPGPVSVELGATGSPGATLNWYADATGGTSLGTGTTFNTPPINTTTTFYVEASDGGSFGSVGPLDPSIGTISASNIAIGTQRMFFDVLLPVVIETMDIFPTAAVGSNGSVTIRDNTQTVIADVPYVTTVTGGAKQTITINVTLQPGIGYEIGQGTAINLNRNTTGAVYPFTSAAINITGNTFDPVYYYFFYNWQWSTGCATPRVPVIATIQNDPPSCPADLEVCVDAPAFALSGGLPDGGVYSGSGVSGGMFNPGLAGVGTHTITYTFCSLTCTFDIEVNDLPDVDITSSGAGICIGDSRQLVGDPAGGTFAVTSGPGTLGAGDILTATGLGTIEISYTYTDGNGCTNVATQSITVNPLPTPFITPANPAICIGDDIDLTANGGVSFLWSTLETDQTINVGPATNTMYSVDVTDANGCTASASTTVVVNALPTPSISPAAPEICPGENIDLTADGGVSFVWSTSETTQTITVAPASTTMYSVDVTDANGCTASASVTVTLYTLPVLTETHVLPTTCFTSDGSIDLTVSGAGPFDYAWTGTGGFVANTEDIGGISAGTYTVVVTDANGCQNSLSVTLDLVPSCGVCPTIDALSANPASVCPDQSTTLEASGLMSMGATYGIQFKYSIGVVDPYTAGTVIATVPNGSLGGGGTTATTSTSFPTPGTYNIYAILNPIPADMSCRPVAATTLQVNDLPVVNITSSDAAMCVDDTRNLTGNPQGGSFSVISGPGTIGAGDVLTATGAGTIEISYTYTNTAGCTNTAIQSILVNPLPTAFAVTGGGAYCSGGAGLPVGLNGSETGVSYQLKRDGTNTGAPVAGTGGAIGFGNQTLAGTYTVEATNTTTLCLNDMSGNVVITINPLPTAFSVTGGGSFCAGGTGVPVGLGGSETGVSYQLKRDGVNSGAPVAGTGGAISFGNQTLAGTYTVEATNTSTLCFRTMTGSVTVTINPAPNTFSVTGGGSYCAGGAGVPVGLGGSETGVNYQLQLNGGNVGAPVAGTGIAISFGNQTATGTYTVIATNATTLCSRTMTGSVVVTISPAPTAFAVNGGGTYCAGGDGMVVGLAGSQTGVNYQLRLGGVNTGAPVAGTGNAISFGLQTAAGTYTVVATNTTTQCVNNMTGSVVIVTYNCNVSITDPCGCKNNATTLADGQFTETITVNAPSGQVWTVSAVTGLYQSNSPNPPVAPLPIALGTVLTETAIGGGLSNYTINGVHVDAIGYNLSVTNGRGLTLSIGNTCAYPNPSLNLPSTAMCLNTPVFTLTGNPGDANLVSQSFTVNGNAATTFNPAVLGIGSHIVRYTVNGGDPKAFGPNDPGCIQSVQQVVNIVATPSNLACNDNVQVSVDENCVAFITPDMILEGSYLCDDDYSIVLRTSTGSPVPNPITANYIGQTIVATVTHIPSGVWCWGRIIVEDKLGPQFECEVTHPVNFVSGTLDANDSRYHRTITFTPGSNPATCVLTNLGTQFYYESIDFTITQAGLYTFNMSNNNYDAFGALYSGGFDPANACQNLIAADDDSGSSIFGAKIVIQLNLVPGNYTLVTTSHSPNTFGSYIWEVGGPGGIPLIARSNVITLSCTQNPADVPAPLGVDNCSGANLVNLISETTTGDACDVVVITRVYQTTDRQGNPGLKTCTIQIRIVQPRVSFPDDITWTCEQYAAYNNIVNPDTLHPIILQNAAAMDLAPYMCQQDLHGDDVAGVAPYDPAIEYWADGEDLDVMLDPNYDDNIDNPVTDPAPNVLVDAVTGRPIWTTLGNASSETDTRPDINNTSLGLCPAYQTIVRIDTLAGPIYHIIDTIIIPRYRLPLGPGNTPLTGLEDADVLALTGSGVPNVFNANGCRFSVHYEDRKLEACEGVDTNIVFKILRTWTILNWCTGEVLTDIQVIKVLDKKKPTIEFFTDERFIIPGSLHYRDTLLGNRFTVNGHNVCASDGLLDVPYVKDNCTGIYRMRVFTPVGEGVPVYNGTTLIGFRIPAPYLPIGRHTITYEVTDGCGNIASATVSVIVIDGIPPVPICREVTQVALGSSPDGITRIQAKYFDEGSYDNCSEVYFKVLKMTQNTCNRANIDKANEIASNQEWFDDDVIFCCSDIQYDAQGNQIPIQVILRVYDVDPGVGAIRTTRQPGTPNDLLHNSFLDQQRYNDCMILVYVEDKIRPVCTAPENVWTTCAALPDNVDLNDTTQLQALFGDAIGYDNCDVFVEELRPSVSIDHCGVGQVIRTWRAKDRAGNTSFGICRQTVMIMQVTNYEIDIPGDFEDECTNARPDTLVWREIGCDLLAVNREDKEFPASAGGECKKIIRTYKIINWCEYDGFSDPTIIPRLDRNRDGKVGDGFTPSNPRSIYRANYRLISNGDYVYLDIVTDPQTRLLVSTGYYVYEQHIKIYDDTAPELRDTLSGPYCGGDRDEDPCTGLVNYLPWIDEECTPDDLTITWQLDRNNDGTFESNGTGRFTGRLPLGRHKLRYRVSDDCGNTSQLDIPFDVLDCKAPTPVCFNGLSIDLMPSGMVEVWACDFDASSFDYCHPLTFRMNRITDVNGDGFITPDDYRSTPPADNFGGVNGCDSIVLRCKDRGVTFVQLWVGEVSSDNVNNWDFCVTFIDVQDNLNACGAGSKVALKGNISNERGERVEKVKVSLNTGESMTTDATGNYSFLVPTGGDYTVTPYRNDDHHNGVSTFDLAMISKHILGVQYLDSPYKMIAADANRSGNISTLDLVNLRKLILRVTNELPNNTSWRFISKDYVFPDPRNPWSRPFPELISINNLDDQVINQDFIAIKVGDVNGSAKANSLTDVDNRSLKGQLNFIVQDRAVMAGEEFNVDFAADQNVLGYQFTLNFDPKALELIDILDGIAAKSFHFNTEAAPGAIATSWNGDQPISGAKMFTAVFRAKTNAQLSDLLSAGSDVTIAEAYDLQGSLMGVGLDFGQSTSIHDGFLLYQNVPNPFKAQTAIQFDLPYPANATLTISDATGKLIKIVKGNYEKGRQVVTLNRSEFPAAGVYYYELTTETDKAIKKMVLIK